MTEPCRPQISKFPFLVADAALLGVAAWIALATPAPLSGSQIALVFAGVALAALIAIVPFILEFRAAQQVEEAHTVGTALEVMQDLKAVQEQIALATGQWQTVQEFATKTTTESKQIAERIGAEARAFTDFLEKANEAERNHLRLELDKLRRAEKELVQIIVRILDHVFALHQAGLRSGQKNLIDQLGQFQNACREAARRIGLVPVVPERGESFNAQLHQTPEEKQPGDDARVGEVLATGYTFQGQFLRPALVTLQNGETPAAPAPQLSLSAIVQNRQASQS